MTTVHDIISDDDIERVHGHARFGSMSKREVVAQGVLKAAFGFSCGLTMRCILAEHGLIRKQRGHASDRMTLTKKGIAYLHATNAYTAAKAVLKSSDGGQVPVVTVDPDICAALVPPAEARGVGVQYLVQALLAAIADDGWDDLILDDMDFPG